jgi:hypothetical protein
MTTDDPTSLRLTALEIDALIRELAQLRQQQPDGVAGNAARLTDDLPPHY